MSKEPVDVCAVCCKWCSINEGKGPEEVAKSYPAMMKTVLRHTFGMSKSAAKAFVSEACAGNWERMHETHIESSLEPEAYAQALLGDVFYCSDRWSWDRVIRVQWMYQRIVERLRSKELGL
jgi:hypothetical protein